ncbi:Myosin-like protein, partial [Globisporangium splendens]
MWRNGRDDIENRTIQHVHLLEPPPLPAQHQYVHSIRTSSVSERSSFSEAPSSTSTATTSMFGWDHAPPVKSESQSVRSNGPYDPMRPHEDDSPVYFTSVQVVNSRLSYSLQGRRFVEYELQINTTSPRGGSGVLYAWHRYSMFRSLAATLQMQIQIQMEESDNGYYRRYSLPKLPSKKIFGNFSDATIHDRIVKLNQFLYAACVADHLEWGILVDDDLCVFKQPSSASTVTASTIGSTRDSLMSTASTASLSPTRRLTMKSFSFRRGSRGSSTPGY